MLFRSIEAVRETLRQKKLEALQQSQASALTAPRDTDGPATHDGRPDREAA